MASKLQIMRQAGGIFGHWAADRVRRTRPQSARDIPANLESVTTEWLTAVLCKDTPGAEVTSWHSPGGSSGTSERAALRVTYNQVGQDAGLPTELFTKSSNSLRQRLLMMAADMLVGETDFYFTFRPRVEMEAPRGYWGSGDERSGRSFLVLEDIASTKGAEFVEATDILKRDEVEDLLGNLAALHGTFWNDPRALRVKSTADHAGNISGLIDMGGRCGVGLERANDILPPGFADQADRVWAGTLKSLEKLAEGPRTLLHGDPHVGQTYRTNDGRMGFTDWQLTMSGGWAYDVACFLGSTCEPEDRREWEAELLGGYLEKLGQAGGQPPSYDEAFLAYRQSMFYYTAGWAGVLGRPWYQPDMQPEATCRTIVRRMSWAMHDLDSFEAIGV